MTRGQLIASSGYRVIASSGYRVIAPSSYRAIALLMITGFGGKLTSTILLGSMTR